MVCGFASDPSNISKSPDGIQAEVLQWLRLVDVDALEEFCNELKVTIPVPKQGNKSLLVKLLMRYLHSEAMEALEYQADSISLKLHSDMEDALHEKGVNTGALPNKNESGQEIKIEPVDKNSVEEKLKVSSRPQKMRQNVLLKFTNYVNVKLVVRLGVMVRRIL